MKNSQMDKALGFCAFITLMGFIASTAYMLFKYKGAMFQSVTDFLIGLIFMIIASFIFFIVLFCCLTLFNASLNIVEKVGGVILQTAYPENEKNKK